MTHQTVKYSVSFCYTNSAMPMDFSKLLNKLTCCFYSNSAPTVYYYGGVKADEVCVFYFLQVPTPILSIEISSKQVWPHSHPFYSHTLPTLFLHVFPAVCLHSCHMHPVVCISLMWHKAYCFSLPGSFMYSISLSLFSLLPFL